MTGFGPNNGVFERNLRLQEKEIKNNELSLKSKPTKMGILFGNKCNLKCKMCGNRGLLTRMGLKKTVKLNKAALDDVISYLPYLELITLSGGEPLLYSETKRIVELAKKYPKLRLKTITNGNLINEYWLDKFCGMPFKVIDFSLDAASAKTYRKIRIRGDFEKVMSSIRRINEMRAGREPILWSTFVVMKRNQDEIFDFVELAHQNRISHICYLPISNQRPLFYALENVTLTKQACFNMLKTFERVKELCDDYNIELVNQLPGYVLFNKPEYFYEYYKIKKKDLNPDEGFGCKRYWKRIDISPNYYTTCVFSIHKFWDPFYFYSQNQAKVPKIHDVWNCEKLLNARKLIANNKYEKVCRYDCFGYFNHKTQGVI